MRGYCADNTYFKSAFSVPQNYLYGGQISLLEEGN